MKTRDSGMQNNTNTTNKLNIKQYYRLIKEVKHFSYLRSKIQNDGNENKRKDTLYAHILWHEGHHRSK